MRNTNYVSERYGTAAISHIDSLKRDGKMVMSNEGHSVNWRYFKLSGGCAGIGMIIRRPPKGIQVHRQKLEDVEAWVPKSAGWYPNFRATVYREAMRGWFSERDDKISKQEAREAMRTENEAR